MRRVAAIVLAGMALGMSGHCVHAAGEPQSGLWKVVMRVEVNGTTLPERIRTVCLNPEMARNPESILAATPNSGGARCKRTSKWANRQLTWQFECPGQVPITGFGTLIFDTPEHYSGKLEFAGATKGQLMKSATALEGQRVGFCTR